MITKYMIEIQMAGRQKNIKSIKLAPMLYSAKHVNPHTAVFFECGALSENKNKFVKDRR